MSKPLGAASTAVPAQAGRRLAGKIAHASDLPDVPILRSPLPRHPLAPFGRMGQAWLYRYYHMRDELL